jgi:putative two-component system response regulator
MTRDTTPKILVVDDLEENTRLLGHLLESKGFRISVAHDGVEALKSVEENPPDVVLLDLIMPLLDGFQVLEKLKQNPATENIPVIIITGMAKRDANVRAIELGAHDFIQKPFEPVLLEARIRSCVRAKVLSDQNNEYQRLLELSTDTLDLAVKDRTAIISKIQRTTVFSLSKLAESRDTETGDHLERMRCYSRELAREMITLSKYKAKYTGEFAEEIFDSSPLHDIGKVGIPDRILLKPGKLTSDEFDIMKTHTTIGGDTLKAADVEAGTNSFLAMGRDIAYSHHEKWDGSGYPYGLSGEDIPLASRIVALGDVYDALSSRRPYKEPFSHEKSKAIILEGRGSHFDPDVVDAFLAIEPTVVDIRERFQGKGHLSPLAELSDRLDHLAEQTEAEAS